MVAKQFGFDTLLLAFLDIAYDCPDFVLDTLKTDISVQVGKNIFLTFGHKAPVRVYVLRFNDPAAAQGRLHIYVLRDLLGKMPVGVAQVGLAHIP